MKEKILIADDSQTNRMLLSDLLGEDYDYLFAADGEQALRLLQSNADIHLLLLDIHMPNLDGLGVLEAMQRRGWIPTLPVIIISSEDDARFIRRAYDLGATDYIPRPLNQMVVQRRVSNTLLLYARQKRLLRLTAEQVYQRERVNTALIRILSHVVETQNQESGTHILHVRQITDLLLHQLNQITGRYPLSQADISRISTLSALHDIGKIHVPSAILNKSGKLTPEEWEIMKSHAAAGDAMLQAMPLSQTNPFIRTAREICRWHHERWDGTGYPDGLCGDEIPISAQVVALADVYDALTSERCYKEALSHAEAIRMILAGKCGAFNPLLYQCLSRAADQLAERIQEEEDPYHDWEESQLVTQEILQQNDLPSDDRIPRLLTLEREKAAFFARERGGLQFLYDRRMNVATYTNWDADAAHRHMTIRLNEAQSQGLLCQRDWQNIHCRAQAAPPEHPDFSAAVTLRLENQERPYRLDARAIYFPGDDLYAGIVGQLKPLPKA